MQGRSGCGEARDAGGVASVQEDGLKLRQAEYDRSADVEWVADKQQYRRLRNYAFFGVSGFVVVLLAMFALWLRSFGERVFNGTLQTDPPHTALFLTPIIVIASLVVVSVLPLMRLVFQDKAQKDDKPAVSLWQSVITELADIFKQYLGSRSKPAG